MRNLAIVLLSILLAGILLFGIMAPDTVPKTDYLKLQDSIEKLNVAQIHSQDYILDLKDSMVILNDSIEDLLTRPLMTSEQFLQLYKYERLVKYYRICKNNPVQWKYYKGWSIRVFEQK